MTFSGPADQAAFYASLPTKRMAAGVLFTDRAGRVLLLQPAYKRTWEIPGGIVAAGESPRQAASRELREELGIDLPVGPLLAVDWVAPDPPRTDALMLVYDGGTLDDAGAAAIRLPAGELNAYGFVDLDGAEGLVSDRLERRIRVALRARRDGRFVELEEGRPVAPPRAWHSVAEQARGLLQNE